MSACSLFAFACISAISSFLAASNSISSFVCSAFSSPANAASLDMPISLRSCARAASLSSRNFAMSSSNFAFWAASSFSRPASFSFAALRVSCSCSSVFFNAQSSSCSSVTLLALASSCACSSCSRSAHAFSSAAIFDSSSLTAASFSAFRASIWLFSSRVPSPELFSNRASCTFSSATSACSAAMALSLLCSASSCSASSFAFSRSHCAVNSASCAFNASACARRSSAPDWSPASRADCKSFLPCAISACAASNNPLSSEICSCILLIC
mmetsp:Transcript_20068/g.34493  ORF Transcript_20068/g.34493 Transcript_20068/m.34493 type:complete len:270 (-) Transcript_20068:1372-2181(-)